MALPGNLTTEDVEPVMHLQLTSAQIAAFEQTTRRKVHGWLKAGRFPEYHLHPGRGDYRIPVWSYLEYRKSQRITAGSGVTG